MTRSSMHDVCTPFRNWTLRASRELARHLGAPLRRVAAVLVVAGGLLTSPAGALGRAVPPDAVSLYMEGRYLQALPLFEAAAAASPEDSPAWTWLGATYYHLNRLQDAVRALQRAATLDLRNPAALLFLGLAYLRTGDTARARDFFRRVQNLVPGTEYARSAAAWLSTLTAGPISIPPASPDGQCPPPPATQQVRQPAVFPAPGSSVEIASWGFSIEGAELVIAGELINTSSRDLENVRVQATGFGIDGRELASVAKTLPGTLSAQDLRDFLLKLPTTPPPIWVRLRIQDYADRPQNESLHTVLAIVPPEEYEPLARMRIKVGVVTIPGGPAGSHTICVWIADAARFPLKLARARITVDGKSPTAAERQVRSVDVTPGITASFTVRWREMMQPAAQVRLETVVLAPPP